VEEQSSGRFSGGAGFSSIDKMMFFAEISQGNFDLLDPPTGGGQKLKLGAQLGSKRKNFDLSLIEPWFLDRRLALGLDLYSNDTDYDDYEFIRQGGAISLGKVLGENVRMDTSYTLEKLRISDVADTNEYFTESGDSYFFEKEDRVSSSARISLTRDRRDNSFIPSEGYRLRVYGAVSGGIFGFDNDIYKAGGSAVYYHPVFESHVVSFRCTYETVDEYGRNEDVPLNDRMFLGGGRSVRGFKYRDVGPKVTRTAQTSDGGSIVYHKPVGGKSLAMATAEYTMSVVPRIRVAFFYDTGNVWEDPFYADMGDLASSAGGGLRFDIPGFPIRIDFAKVIKKDDELTRTEPWVLWIGHDF
jgi:outer membrane protein insertion porin family